ncbi:MAG TPA: universal stress protein [Actinophytocola sp.]|jgi:nucleotide-binding universal stress UspA family protein|uniref:universal stress protein n=1 Tax=Actinophytocola sp. TaxID=1872138 RepID=UPI002F9546EF
MTGQNGIVVGVDGSAASVAALRWAITRAMADHCTITAVEVRPRVHLAPGTSYAIQPYGTAPPAERLHTRLHDTVAATVATVADAPEIVEIQLEGDPGVELARAAADHGGMLVLGYHPHSRVSEFLLGRVTGECLRHARRPVVLVPAVG